MPTPPPPKNAAWRMHSNLVSACRAALDRLDAVTNCDKSPASPLLGLSPSNADTVLHPLALALALALAVDTTSAKVAESALDCAEKLFSLGLIRGEIDDGSDGEDRQLHAASGLLASSVGAAGSYHVWVGKYQVQEMRELGGDAIELHVLRVLIAIVQSPSAMVVHGECLAQIVNRCYDVNLGSQNGTNQPCAKLVLAQILTIIYARVEVDTTGVRVRVAWIADMLDLSDRNQIDTSLIKAAQRHINEAMEGSESEVLPPEVQKGDGGVNGAVESGELSRIKEGGLFLFKNLCKLSIMKFLIIGDSRGSCCAEGGVLSLEPRKMVIDIARSL